MASAISLGKALRPKFPKVPAATNGGTIYPGAPGSKPTTTSAPLNATPPAFTFDPALAAKEREAQLKEEQNLEDIKTQEHFNASDFHTALRSLKTTGARKRQQFGLEERHGNDRLDREQHSGEERLGNEEADTKKNAGRQFEDFATKRKEIGRQFGELATRQAEAQNAGGTLDQGTSSAAAAARARNQQISEAPISTSESRLGEDLATALSRITGARQKLGTESDRERTELVENLGIGRSQLHQNLTQEHQEAKQNLGRKDFQLGREEQRTKFAGVNAKQNYFEEEIYQAMEEHPAEFTKWAEENPGLLPAGVGPSGVEKGGAAAGGKRTPAAPPVAKNGGISYPGKKKKGGR
jgi:hypothetical protein